MRSKRLRKLPHTLAFRLTLWYALVFTLSCAAALVLFYLLATDLFRQRTDRELLARAAQFSKTLETGGLDAVMRRAITESQAAGEKKTFFRVLTPSGGTFSSTNMSFWRDIKVNRQDVQKLLAGEAHVFETIHVAESNDRIRILYAFLGPRLLIQIGQLQETHARLLEAFRSSFVAGSAFLLALATAIGWFMARRALSGLSTVTRTARRISTDSLDERVPIQNHGEEIDQLAITFNQMLDRIQHLVTGIKEMSDNIAHDLRSPLARIRGAAEVALTTGADRLELEQMAASTIEESDRLLDMINTMLVISETEAGTGKWASDPVQLAGVLADAVDLFSPLAEDKGIDLTLATPEPLEIYGDQRMLQRMVANLLDNAIKFTPSDGRISVSLDSTPDGSARIRVADTGQGIPRTEQDQIFRRFYRADQSRTKSGVGLGLSLARTIARAHGGDIEIASTPGQGSVFTVILSKKNHRGGQKLPNGNLPVTFP